MPAAIPAPVSQIFAPKEILGAGDKIGRYKIEKELGSGAMGVVYKAHDPNTDRFVAVKVLQPGLDSRAKELEQRFRREARAAGRLKHTNIVIVHDADVVRGQWCIIVEYLDGNTLGELIELEGGQTVERVAFILTQVCAALDYAHGCGVIHRDIKPSNIMILENDQIKVTDFDLASIVAEPSLTQTDAVFGHAALHVARTIQGTGG